MKVKAKRLNWNEHLTDKKLWDHDPYEYDNDDLEGELQTVKGKIRTVDGDKDIVVYLVGGQEADSKSIEPLK